MEELNNEVKILKNINHSNVLKVYEEFKIQNSKENLICIVIELAKGKLYDEMNTFIGGNIIDLMSQKSHLDQKMMWFT